MKRKQGKLSNTLLFLIVFFGVAIITFTAVFLNFHPPEKTYRPGPVSIKTEILQHIKESGEVVYLTPSQLDLVPGSPQTITLAMQNSNTQSICTHVIFRCIASLNDSEHCGPDVKKDQLVGGAKNDPIAIRWISLQTPATIKPYDTEVYSVRVSVPANTPVNTYLVQMDIAAFPENGVGCADLPPAFNASGKAPNAWLLGSRQFFLTVR